MKVTEFIDSIKDELIEKMEKLVTMAGLDVDGDSLDFLNYEYDPSDEGWFPQTVYFNLLDLKCGDPDEIAKAIRTLMRIESGEYIQMLTFKREGGKQEIVFVPLEGIFE